MDKKKVAIMNTGDSNYGTPFRPHSFATRKNAKKNGLILALTYGNQLSVDTQQELSAIGEELGTVLLVRFFKQKKSFWGFVEFS